MEELTLMPAPQQRASIDGRPFRFSDPTRRQQLNLYVPDGMYALALEAGAAPEQLAQIVPPAQTAQLAQAERAPAAAAQRLPNTAGPLPLLAHAGLLSVLGGLGLSIRRYAGAALARARDK